MSQPGFIREWLGDREHDFRGRLHGTSLVVEANIDENLMETAAELFGQHVGTLHRVHKYTGHEIAKKYPAITLVTLVGHAATDYEQNRYWEGYWDKLGVPREQGLEQDFRKSVPGLLAKFGLALFPQLDGKYVQQLAMHAGIPNYCLRGVVEAIGTHLGAGREPTGTALIEWLSDPTRPHRMNVLNVPARNFLRDGGEFAVDIVDRILELVLFAADNPTDWAQSVDSGTVSAEATGLPGVMFDGLLDILEECGTELVPYEQRTRTTAGAAPYLMLDTMEDTVLVCLPHPGTGLVPAWTVSLDGEAVQARGVAGWGPPDQQPPTRVAVARPVRAVTVTHAASAHGHTLTLVDPADPMVLFTDDGRLVGRRQPIPVGTVYALLPGGHDVADGSTGEILEPDLDLGVPSGWLRWRLVTVSTVGLRSLQLVDEDGARVGAARVVRNSYLPEVLLDPKVPGVTSVNGGAVYSARPEVWLPRHPAGDTIRWQVGVRRIGERDWITQRTWELDAEDRSVDPFDDTAEGLLGGFETLVRGPLGSDLRRTVFLAEGLSVDVDPVFRHPDGVGLSPAKVLLDADGPLEVSDAALDFDSHTQRRVVTATSGRVSEQVVIAPPHLEFRLDPRGHRPVWSALPHVSAPEDFVANRIVAVRVPADEAVVYIELVDADGEVRQAEQPRYRENADAFEVSTVRFTDTVRAMGAGRIMVTVETPDQPAVVVPAVHIRPARLYRTVDLAEGVVRFTGLAPVAGLALEVWCEAAPWRPVRVLPVIGDELTLPDDLRDIGPLLVSMTVHDGWTVTPVSPTPGPDADRLVQAGWAREPDPGLDHLSRLLVGLPCEPALAVGRPELWAAYVARRTDRGGDSPRILRELSTLLTLDPRASLEALASSSIPPEATAELLIRSRLVLAEFGAYGVWDEISAHPWMACMIALADLPDLPLGSDNRAEALSAARRQGGGALLHLARTGQDRHVSSGLFDRSTVILASMPEFQVEQIFEHASIVPSELLERDTRVTAIAEAFAARERWTRTGACRALPELIGTRSRIVERISRDLYTTIAVRSEALDGVDTAANPWVTMPLMSIGVALLARLQAHRIVPATVVETDLVEAWAVLARMCPKLVLSDLLIAEALVVHHKYGNTLGDKDV